MKRLRSLENGQCQLEVIECDCGFHIGLDVTYMEQVGEIVTVCPACTAIIDTRIVCPEDGESPSEPDFIVLRHHGWQGHQVECKRLSLPMTIQAKCPRCKKQKSKDLSKSYISYPNLGQNFLPMLCDECDHEWTLKFSFDAIITPIPEENMENH
jgi:hypothetical protein